MDDDRIKHLNEAYDLDGGGYSFEDAPEGLKDCACVVWTDPDPDSVPWIVEEGRSARYEFYGLDCPVYAFAPNSGHFPATEWPKEYKDGDSTYELVRQGSLEETDRECNCHGRLDWWTGAAGEPREPIPAEKVLAWIAEGKVALDAEAIGTHQRGRFYCEFSGNSSDKPHPECTRCDGDGYVNSDGGSWALYARKGEPDEEE